MSTSKAVKYPKVKFMRWLCTIEERRYGNGRLALELVDSKGEPVAVATVNVPGSPLADDEVFIKDYSENEGMLDSLVAAGIVERTGKSVQSGFISIPVAKLLVRQ